MSTLTNEGSVMMGWEQAAAVMMDDVELFIEHAPGLDEFEVEDVEFPSNSFQ